MRWTARFLCLGGFFVLLVFVSAAFQEDPSLFRIMEISPNPASAGSEVRIRFEFAGNERIKQIDIFERFLRDREVRVFFDDLPAQITFVSRSDLRVIVPNDLFGESVPGVTLTVGDFSSPPFRRFKVAAFEILSIEPDSAETGSKVMITLSKDISHPVKRVTFDGKEGEIIEATPRNMQVSVPEELEPGSRPLVYAFIGDERSEPFNSFKLKSTFLDKVIHPVFTPLFFILLIILSALFYSNRRRVKANRRMREEALARKEGADAYYYLEDDNGIHLPMPEIPENLVRDCLEGNCVLFAGAGLSAPAGFPTWAAFVGDLLDWSIKKEIVDKDFGNSLRYSLKMNQTDLVADSIVSMAQTNDREKELTEFLREIFVSSKPSIPRTYRLLKSLNCAAVLTTNFDNLLEETFSGGSFKVYTPFDTDALLEALPNREHFILKLYGSLDQPETVLVAPAQYEATISGNRPFSEFMESLFYSKTILFLGASLEGIDAYLEGIKFREYSTTPHYALVAVRGEAWKAKADLLKRRYGIEVIPYTVSGDHPEVSEFLKSLVDRLKSQKRDRTGFFIMEDNSEIKPKTITRFHLENLGPFHKLNMDLDPNWNILLGDNGVGKSTILRAIALAICGEEAVPFADRLIKSGQNSAKVILETSDRKQYTTHINKMNGRVEIKNIPEMPLKSERWLALGFPPIRSVSWEPIKGPLPEEGRRRFSPEDLLPLVRGEHDPRMEKLKQWIVNLDYRIKDERSRGEENSRYQQLFDEFFRIVDQLTEGLTLTFKEVDPKTKRVMVITDDGEVPIEAVSQGTTSIIGWIGILLQRLYEIYGDEKRPTQEYALVLIDEIDAHMHPSWQQSLVPSLKKIFPKVQFVATTHSPLIVGGMAPHEIYRFLRHDGTSRISIERMEESFAGWRADQLLTSGLFGLDSTRDPHTQELVDRYSKLTVLETPNDSQKKELAELARELKLRLPSSEEKKEAREASKMIQQSFREEFSQKPEDEKRKIMKEMEMQLQDVVTRSRRES